MPSYRSQFYGEEIDERLGKIPQMESDIEHLKTNGGINEEVKKVVDTALEEAKVSGEFNGEDGFSPVVEVTRYSDTVTGKSGMTVTVQNKDGTFNSASVEDGKDGTNGKSAYEYAVDGGFEGTEEDFIKLLADGEIYIGTEEPTDPNIKIWVKTDGTKPNISLFENDVGYITAKDVPEAPQADWSQNDETAADYIKNRTHWVEVEEDVYFSGYVGLTEEESIFTGNYPNFVVGQTYNVEVYGTQYECEGFEIDGMFVIGNPELFGGENNDLPFSIIAVEGTLVVTLNGEEGSDVTIITEIRTVHKLPAEFIDANFIVKINNLDENVFSCNKSMAEILAARAENKTIIGEFATLGSDGLEIYRTSMCAFYYIGGIEAIRFTFLNRFNMRTIQIGDIEGTQYIDVTSGTITGSIN